MTGSSALLQAVNVNVYAAAATTYTLSLSFSWLLFVSDEKPRTAKVVRGHFNHNLFLLISRKTLKVQAANKNCFLIKISFC